VARETRRVTRQDRKAPMMTQSTRSTGPSGAASWWTTHDDRRESPRPPLSFSVRSGGEDLSELTAGDLSLGGAGWLGTHRPPGTRVELTLTLAGEAAPLQLSAEVFRATPDGDLSRVQARFVDLALSDELTLARWLHQQAQERLATGS